MKPIITNAIVGIAILNALGIGMEKAIMDKSWKLPEIERVIQ